MMFEAYCMSSPCAELLLFNYAKINSFLFYGTFKFPGKQAVRVKFVFEGHTCTYPAIKVKEMALMFCCSVFQHTADHIWSTYAYFLRLRQLQR